MKSLRKKFFVSMLAVMMALSSITAYASIMPVSKAQLPTPRWDFVNLISSGMDVDDNNYATISVIADAQAYDVDKVVVKCELQQLVNSSWKTIKTWNEENNDCYILFEKNYAIAKGYSYRLKTTVKAYKGNTLLETATSYSEYGYYH